MRTKVLLVGSLALNLALALAVSLDRRASKRLAGVDLSSRGPAPATNPTIRISKTNIMLGSVLGFTWRDVEAPDYRKYITNLRGVGCPDSTIRDIIVADVNQLYQRKWLASAPTNDVAWWRSDADRQRQMVETNLRAELDQERRALLTNLLGPNWEVADTPTEPGPVALVGPILGAMPAETQQKVQAIQNVATEKLRAYQRQISATGQKEDPVYLARLEDEARAKLAEVMTPGQMEEFQLRYSPVAMRLREQFRGFDLTPEEFRLLLRETQAADARFVQGVGEGKTSDQERQELAQQREGALLSVLSPERYAEWSVQQSPAFHEALDAAVKAGASPQAAVVLYQIGQAAVSERDRIQNDPNLSEDERMLELEEIDQQEAKARDQVLGKPPKPEKPTPQPTLPPMTHTTGPYETVAHISLQYGVPMGAILQANPGVDWNHLLPGTSVSIPAWNPRQPAAGGAPPAPGR